MTDAVKQVDKTRQALQTLMRELVDRGELTQAEAIAEVLRSEMSVLRLAAILAPERRKKMQ